MGNCLHIIYIHFSIKSKKNQLIAIQSLTDISQTRRFLDKLYEGIFMYIMCVNTSSMPSHTICRYTEQWGRKPLPSDTQCGLSHVGGGPSHGHRQHAQKIGKDHACGSRDILTDRQTAPQTNILITILRNRSRRRSKHFCPGNVCYPNSMTDTDKPHCGSAVLFQVY